MKQARELAWTLYVTRVQRILEEQKEKWFNGQPSHAIIMNPPTGLEINHIVAALTAAEDEGIHRSLGPVVRLIDEMDNNKQRTQAFKDQRRRLQEVDDEIRAMKSTSVNVAK